MKTYFVFAGDQYYPKAGISDLVNSFSTQEEADAYAEKINEEFDWVKVVDIRGWL